MNFFAELAGSRMLFFDGGMGTLLQDAGLKPGELPESWNISHPETVLSVHRQYLEAGAILSRPTPLERILSNCMAAHIPHSS